MSRKPIKKRENSDIEIEDEGDQEKNEKGFAWEAKFKRSWEIVQEDEAGSLNDLVHKLNLQIKKRRQQRDTAIVQRGIIRHLLLILDLSLSMNEKDLRPSRLQLTLNYIESFINEFFDQNPISQLGIITTKDGLAEKISEMSGNPMEHIKAIQMKVNQETSGEPSLQNALELAKSSLVHTPLHASREVLGIFGSLTTCDPGNIYDTVDDLKKQNIRCSMIGLSAEVHVFKKVASLTGGEYNVVFNESHYKDILFDMTPPPPISAESKSQSSLVTMGFPIRLPNSNVSFCVCHGESKSSGYECPRCKSKVCEIPIDCSVCQLTLISSPHLARSYHHLFPIENFKELSSEEAKQKNCSGCFKRFNIKQKKSKNSKDKSKSTKKISLDHYQCTKCKSEFCFDCDLFIHNNLHNCPGCTLK